jgi:Tol biopolymer transport system component
VLDPAVSPDGTSIAFIQQPPPQVRDGRFDAGSNLWVMNRDGSGARLLLQHAQPNQLIRFPRWETNTSVLAIVQEISTENAITRVVYTLQRIDAATGERQRVMDDVLAFDISPDGQRLVFARLLPQAGEALMASNVSGEGGVEVVGADQSLAPFGSPRFSPDGQAIAFASADQTGARAPVQLVSLERDANGRFGHGPDAKAAAMRRDGLPQDIWTVESTGGRAVRVADIKEDLPALTWDGSGELIYVMGVNGLYEVNVKTGGVVSIGEGAFHAQLTWAP